MAALFGAVLVAAPTAAATVAVAALAVGVARQRSTDRVGTERNCLPDEACADA